MLLLLLLLLWWLLFSSCSHNLKQIMCSREFESNQCKLRFGTNIGSIALISLSLPFTYLTFCFSLAFRVSAGLAWAGGLATAFDLAAYKGYMIARAKKSVNHLGIIQSMRVTSFSSLFRRHIGFSGSRKD